MWSHYADSHRGAILGLRFDEVSRQNLYDVLYLDKPISTILENGHIKIIDENFRDCDLRDLTATVKHNTWRYEQEVRILQNNSKGTVEERYVNGIQMHFINFEKLSLDIAEVIIGARCSKADEYKIRNLTHTHWCKAKIYKAECPSAQDKFCVERNEIINKRLKKINKRLKKN